MDHNPSETHSYTLEILVNSATAVYKLGEKILFFARVFKDDVPLTEGVAHFEILKDNQSPIKSGNLPLNMPGACIVTSLDEPGFIECRVTYTPEGSPPIRESHGAAVAPLDIKPSLPLPDDFDDFWEEQKERLAAIPMKVSEVEREAHQVLLYDIRIDCVGEVPVSAYLAKPLHAKPNSAPAFITPHGAGCHSAKSMNAIQLASMGYLALDINAHGLLNDQPKSYYEEMAAGPLADYRHRGMNESPGQVYFVDMFLRMKRAIEYMTGLEEWDGENLFIMGSSQGAFQTFAGAYLDKRVKAIAVGVPAGSDLTGSVINRVTGWPSPQLMIEKKGWDRDKVMHSCRYIDNMNFAAKIEVPALFSVGFVDGTCKPTTVYAVYNNYAGPKRIINRPRMGHTSPREIRDEFIEFLTQQISKV